MSKPIEYLAPIRYDRDLLSDLISTAMSSECGFAWWKESDPAAREAAKAALIKEGIAEPCVEDVFAEILVEGGTLMLLDPESDWHWSGHGEGELLWSAQIIAEGCEPIGGNWKVIRLEDILRGVAEYGEARVANDCGPSLRKIVESGDFWDADAVFQYAAYGDLIYG